jgi:predicted metal-dependent TIM-barrel fold hydrolase
MIDTHMHADTRPYEDFEAMSLAGITDILTLAHDPMRMSSSIVVADHFERLLIERERVEKNGIKLHVCLGLHPRIRPNDLDVCLELLESYLKAKKAVAIGETGLESGDAFEIGMLQRQVELAIKYRLPIIVHTPRKNKAAVTRDILGLLSSFSLDRSSVVVDHANAETAKQIVERGYNAGLTVQPSKLTPREATEIIKSQDHHKLVLNTDASSNPTDVLGIPRTVHLMKLEKFNEEVIASVSELNARRVFGI